MTTLQAKAFSALGAILIASATWAGSSQADVLELRDGERLEGTFRGADSHAIQFDVDEQVHLIPLDQAQSLTFGASTDRAQPLPPPEDSARSEAPKTDQVSVQQLPQPAPQHPMLGTAPATSPRKTAKPAASATPARPAARTPAATKPRSLEIPPGTLLRVRLTDTLDPRFGAEGDRFAGLLETEFRAGGKAVIPAKTRVYGVVSEARTQGPIAGRLKLELSALMLSGEMIRVVSGTHKVVAPAGAGPAKAGGSRSDRIPAGTVLEFRLLQAAELKLRR